MDFMMHQKDVICIVEVTKYGKIVGLVSLLLDNIITYKKKL